MTEEMKEKEEGTGDSHTQSSEETKQSTNLSESREKEAEEGSPEKKEGEGEAAAAGGEEKKEEEPIDFAGKLESVFDDAFNEEEGTREGTEAQSGEGTGEESGKGKEEEGKGTGGEGEKEQAAKGLDEFKFPDWAETVNFEDDEEYEAFEAMAGGQREPWTRKPFDKMTESQQEKIKRMQSLRDKAENKDQGADPAHAGAGAGEETQSAAPAQGAFTQDEIRKAEQQLELLAKQFPEAYKALGGAPTHDGTRGRREDNTPRPSGTPLDRGERDGDGESYGRLNISTPEGVAVDDNLMTQYNDALESGDTDKQKKAFSDILMDVVNKTTSAVSKNVKKEIREDINRDSVENDRKAYNARAREDSTRLTKSEGARYTQYLEIKKDGHNAISRLMTQGSPLTGEPIETADDAYEYLLEHESSGKRVPRKAPSLKAQPPAGSAGGNDNVVSEATRAKPLKEALSDIWDQSY